jgi:DNA transformation protein
LPTPAAYARSGKTPVAMPYSTLPDEAFEDSDSAAYWSRLALAAARRASAAKPAREPFHRRTAHKKG